MTLPILLPLVDALSVYFSLAETWPYRGPSSVSVCLSLQSSIIINQYINIHIIHIIRIHPPICPSPIQSIHPESLSSFTAEAPDIFEVWGLVRWHTVWPVSQQKLSCGILYAVAMYGHAQRYKSVKSPHLRSQATPCSWWAGQRLVTRASVRIEARQGLMLGEVGLLAQVTSCIFKGQMTSIDGHVKLGKDVL